MTDREASAARDAAWVERATAGDQEAARALFRAHHRAVLSVCLLSANRDQERARDLAQDTFARAFRYLHTLNDPARFRPWVVAIAVRVCQTRGASAKRYREALATFALEQDVQLADDDVRGREERAACVRRVLESVSDPQLRSIVTLKYTDPEHTTRQIAEQLQIPHGTVTVSLMRFRNTIKRRLVRELHAQEVYP